MRIFLSYSDHDTRFVGELLPILHQQQFEVVRSGYFAQEQHWRKEIMTCPVVLFILSRGSARSEMCQGQWQYALECNKKLIVLKLDAVEIPDSLGHANLIDYLDFEQIGRQILDGIPSLTRDRYATEVSLRMLIAELAEARRMEEERTSRNPLASDDPFETARIPDPDTIRRAQAALQKKNEASPEPEPPLKRLARHLRRIRGQDG